MDLFGWIRRKFAEATASGIGDGLALTGVISYDETADPEKVRAAITERLALPTPKAAPVPPSETSDETKTEDGGANLNGHAAAGNTRTARKR